MQKYESVFKAAIWERLRGILRADALDAPDHLGNLMPSTFNQRAVAAGENRRTVDKTRPLLLAPAGGEPPDTAAVCRHAAEDRGVAGTAG